MSCGDHHDTDCSEVLAAVYNFLDGEINDGERHVIRIHLDECSPCLRQFGIEQEVKALVARCCGSDRALTSAMSVRSTSDGAICGGGATSAVRASDLSNRKHSPLNTARETRDRAPPVCRGQKPVRAHRSRRSRGDRTTSYRDRKRKAGASTSGAALRSG